MTRFSTDYYILNNTSSVEVTANVMLKIDKQCISWDKEKFARLIDQAEGMIVVGCTQHCIIAVAETVEDGLGFVRIKGNDSALMERILRRITRNTRLGQETEKIRQQHTVRQNRVQEQA